MMWTTRVPLEAEWTTDDETQEVQEVQEAQTPEWTPSDELLDEDELDDFQLARLGLDVPNREWVEPVERPRPRLSMEEMIESWTTSIDANGGNGDLFRRAMESVYDNETGSFTFGDDEAHEVVTPDDDDDDEYFDDVVDDYYDPDDDEY